MLQISDPEYPTCLIRDRRLSQFPDGPAFRHPRGARDGEVSQCRLTPPSLSAIRPSGSGSRTSARSSSRDADSRASNGVRGRSWRRATRRPGSPTVESGAVTAAAGERGRVLLSVAPGLRVRRGAVVRSGHSGQGGPAVSRTRDRPFAGPGRGRRRALRHRVRAAIRSIASPMVPGPVSALLGRRGPAHPARSRHSRSGSL